MDGGKDATSIKDNPAGPTPESGHLYCMVGAHHLYTLDTPDAGQDRRRDIEQQYADRVAEGQKAYVDDIATGASADSESDVLNQRLGAAAAARDEKLAEICGNGDGLLAKHPELHTEVEGPYQVVRIGYHLQGGVRVFDTCQVLPPWPGYRSYVSRPYGWSYGRVFPYHEFVRTHRQWYGRIAPTERPAYSGLVGHRGPVSVGIVRTYGSRPYAIRPSGYGGYGAGAKPILRPPTGYGSTSFPRRSTPPPSYGSDRTPRTGDGYGGAPKRSTDRPSGYGPPPRTDGYGRSPAPPVGVGGYGGRSSAGYGGSDYGGGYGRRPTTGYGGRPPLRPDSGPGSGVRTEPGYRPYGPSRPGSGRNGTGRPGTGRAGTGQYGTSRPGADRKGPADDVRGAPRGYGGRRPGGQ